MPTYDYQCESCQHTFEKRQSFHDEPVASCPVCNSKAKRKISLVPVIFKGNGWYVTDYSKKSSTVSSTNGQSESKPEGTKGATGAKDSKETKDTKPLKTEPPIKSGANGHKADSKKEIASSKKSETP